MVQVYGFSHPGNVRKMNEDSWRTDLELGVFLVADGMGGHNAGEVASEMAAESIFSFMRRTRDGEDVTWPYGIDPKLSFQANRVRTSIKLANRRVFRAAETKDEYTGMGTTVVMIYLDETEMVCGNVGDSRIYMASNGSMSQLTTDDSWVQTIHSANPEIKDLGNHPMKHVLTKVVGARDQVDVQVIERPNTPGETLLLCSDGLHGELTDEQIAGIIGNGADPKPEVEQLIEAVLSRKARDNVTAVVIKT